MDHSQNLINALQQAWQREMEGAVAYRALAEQEEENRKRVLIRLAETEERHAARWAQRLAELDGPAPRPEKVKSPLRWSLRVARPEVLIQKMEAQEDRDIAAYERLLAEVNDEVSQQIAREALRDEYEHARLLCFLAGTGSTPDRALELILRREKWHVRGGSWIGAAIYGVNDGLGVVFGIVSGVAGATGADHYYCNDGWPGRNPRQCPLNGLRSLSRGQIGAGGL